MTEITPEELHHRLHENSSTPDDERVQCPDCESVNVHPRNPGNYLGDAHRESNHDYVCEACDRSFDEEEANE